MLYLYKALYIQCVLNRDSSQGLTRTPSESIHFHGDWARLFVDLILMFSSPLFLSGLNISIFYLPWTLIWSIIIEFDTTAVPYSVAFVWYWVSMPLLIDMPLYHGRALFSMWKVGSDDVDLPYVTRHSKT